MASNKRTGRLSRQLIRRIVLLSSIAIVALLIAIAAALSRDVQTVQGEINETSLTAARTFDQFLGGIQSDLFATSDALVTTNDMDELFRRVLERQFPVFELTYVDPEGNIIAQRRRSGISGETSVTEQPWIDTVQQNELYVGPVDSEEFGVPFTDLAVAIIDEEGNFAGTLIAQVDLTTLWGDIIAIRIGDNGYAYIADEDGDILVYRDLDFIQGKVYEELLGHPINSEEGRALLEGFFVHQGITGEQAIATAIPLEAAPWFVFVEQPLAEAMQPFVRQSAFLLVALLSVFLLVYSIIRFTRRRIITPLLTIREGVDTLGQKNLEHRIEYESDNELGELAAGFNTMAAELDELVGTLEERIQLRTRDLEVAAEVGTRIAQQAQDLDTLLATAVELIRTRFDMYYTQIYLVSAKDNTLILRAGTGDVGQELLQQGHYLPLDTSSINGTVAVEKEAVLVADTSASYIFHANPLLPDTRSEMAVPLRVGQKVIGVLDLQSERPYALSEENLPVFETLAGQLAVTIENATLLTESLRLSSIVRQSPDGAVIANMDKIVEFANPSWAAMHGYEVDEIIGQSISLFHTEEQVKMDVEPFNAVVFAKGSNEGIVGHRRRDGTSFPTRMTVNLIYDEAHNPIGLMASAQDITEQQRAEHLLNERVKQLDLLNDIGRKAAENLPVGVFLQWVTERIPQAMRHSDKCVVAIALHDEVYGQVEATELRRHFVEELRIRGERAGRIYVAYTEEGYIFGDEESSMMGGVSRRIGSFIESQSLLEQLQAQAEDLQKVVAISTTIAIIDDPQQLLQELTDLIYAQFNLYQVNIFLLEDETLTVKAISGKVGSQFVTQAPALQLQTQKSLVARAARTRQSIMINDVHAEPDFMTHALLPDVASELIVPLLVGDQILGVLDVESDEIDRFSESDLSIFTTLGAQIAVTLQNTRQHEQAEEALRELNTLQRVITGEGWQSYLQTQTSGVKGYVANHQRVEPIMDTAVSNGHSSTDVVVPLSVRGANIGQLGVKNAADLADEDRELLEAVSRQVAEALERARLFEESELSRQQTNALYTGSEQVVRANSIDEVLEALAQSTAVSRMDWATFLFFEHIWDDARPETMTVTAVWENSGETSLESVGTVYMTEQFAILDVLAPDEPIIISDIDADERQDENTRQLFQQWGMKSVMAFALVAGDQWIGIMTAQSRVPMQVSEDEMKQISSLVNQAAVVAQTQQLFDATEARAQQEQILRQVSERVYGAADTESVLKTAVQEVGRALGLEAFVYLEGNSDDLVVTHKSKVKSSKKS